MQVLSSYLIKHFIFICDSDETCQCSFFITVNFLNIRTPENFAVYYLKFKQRGQTLRELVKKMQVE